MEVFKMRFKWNGLELELEGNEKIVREEFSVFKEFMVESVIPKLENNSLLTSSSNDAVQMPLTAETSDYPHLKEVVMRDLPKTEVEWILIYGFYASKFGQEPFSENDIKSLYDISKRRNLNRMKNFSANLNRVINNGLIKILNENDFIISQKGLDQAQMILNHEQNAIESDQKGLGDNISITKRTKKAGKTSTKSKGPQILTSLNLRQNNVESIRSFYERYSANTFFEKNLVFVYYLEKVLQESGITLNHIYTCYKSLSIKVPGNIYQSVIDTRKIKGWLDMNSMNDIRLSIHGEQAVEHELKN